MILIMILIILYVLFSNIDFKRNIEYFPESTLDKHVFEQIEETVTENITAENNNTSQSSNDFIDIDKYIINITNIDELLKFDDLTESGLEATTELLIYNILSIKPQNASYEIVENSITVEIVDGVKTTEFMLRDYYSKENMFIFRYDYTGDSSIRTV